MSDNVRLNPGTGGALLAADDIGGVLHQRVKPCYGTDGNATDVSDTNPMPVDDAGGTLTVDDGGGSLTVDGTVTSQVARTTSHVGATLSSDAVMIGTTALTPKFANILVAANGDNTLVAAVADKKIRVLSLMLVATSTVNCYFKDSAPANLCGDGTSLFKLDPTGVAGIRRISMPFNPVGWFQTSTTNVNLVLNLSGAVPVSGCLTYVEV